MSPYRGGEQQPAGLSTAERPEPPIPSSTMMKAKDGSDHVANGHDTAESNKIRPNNPTEEEGGSSNSKRTSPVRKSPTSASGTAGSQHEKKMPPRRSSLTNSAPTILVSTPDDESYQRIQRPLRSSMTSRTLHESLHRGQRGSRDGKKTSISRSVSFASVNIREYERILGDNPSCTSGPPIGIGWRFSQDSILVSVDDFEEGKGDTPRSSSEYLVPKAVRERLLKEHTDVSRRDIAGAVRAIQKQKSQRRKTVVNLGMQGTEEKVEIVRRSLQKVFKTRKSYAVEERKLWDDAHERAVEKAKRLEDSIRKGESVSMRNVYSIGTPTNNMLPSRRNSGEHFRVEEKLVKQYLNDEESKEEEEAPPASDHEIVSKGIAESAVASQPPPGELGITGSNHQLRQSIVIEEADDDSIFNTLST